MNQTRDNPLITIVIATLNSADVLRRSIESVAAQSYRNVELLVVDGGSVDGTLDVIRDMSDIVSTAISEPDEGIYDAWNKGLRLAHGDWICFLGADDLLLEDAFENYIRFIRDHPDPPLLFISSLAELVPESGKTRVVGNAWSWPAFSRKMDIVHVGALHHRDLFTQYGVFDTRYRICGDYDLLLRARNALPAAFIPQVTVRLAAGGVSRRDVGVFLETYRAKVESGGRLKVAARVERFLAHLKWRVRRVREGVS
ncbi:glycosyltransferase family 2 protein [Paraburkholderia sp. BCC1876]|uniref:glycosyltransferase family 2 protein n=1 Tax=Paraburkholderia sp. BCC1876 TaxID=2676303 RepID=UPI0015923CC6|nr:glycosyltransferase family 2 protein [Paraburkholderia sp. BCC1876]